MQGHVVLLLKRGGGALFSGDHLGGIESDIEKPDLRLEFKAYNHYSGTSFTSHHTGWVLLQTCVLGSKNLELMSSKTSFGSKFITW